MSKICFGIDVGGTTIKTGVFDSDCKLIQKDELLTRKEEGGSFILDDICAYINHTIKELGYNNSDVIGVGIGVPGPVVSDGTVLRCVNLGWDVFNITHKLSKMLDGIKVKASNDANVAALGEITSGGGRGYKDMVMVTLGTGVGGGVIIDGNIVNGSNGAAGEIGHMPIASFVTEQCTCGKTGCLEQVASATGIVKQADRYFAKNKVESKLVDIKNYTAKDVLDCAKGGDQAAKDIMKIVFDCLGNALANVASVVNPEAIVIGGGVSRAGQYLIDGIKESFERQAFLPCRNVQFKLAELGNDAGIYGGAAMAITMR